DDAQFARAPEGKGTSTGGKIFRVDERNGRIESFVYGPFDYWAIDRLKAELRAIDVELGKPASGNARVDRLTERRNEIQRHDLPRLECRHPFGDSEEGRASLPLVVEKKPGGASISIGSQAQELAEGAWSS